MSYSVFPVLPGLKFDITKSPEFSTLIQKSTSGFETAVTFWSYPIWHFALAYEFLRDDATYNELKTLLGFFLQRKGSFERFLYSDPSDNKVTAQGIGSGDGHATQFQLVRSFGGFDEPMYFINGAPVIYLNGSKMLSGWSVDSYGMITFTSAPAIGALITADFSFYYRVRFDKDLQEYNEFMYQLWELQTCELTSVKGHD